MVQLWLVLVLSGLSLWWFRSKRLPPDFPPGPRFPLPLVGDAFALGRDVTQGFKKLAEK